MKLQKLCLLTTFVGLHSYSYAARNSVLELVDQVEDLADSPAQYSYDRSRSEKQALETYYRNMIDRSVEQFQRDRNRISDSWKKYAVSYESFESKARSEVMSGSDTALKGLFQNCMDSNHRRPNFKVLDERLDLVENYLRSLKNRVGSRIRSGSERDFGGIENAMDPFSSDTVSSLNSCCSYLNSSGAAYRECTSLASQDLPRWPSAPGFYDPLAMNPEKQDVLIAMLAGPLKRVSSQKLSDYEMENIFEEALSVCEDAPNKKKNKIFTPGVWAELSKTVRCHALPFVATQYWDLEWQKMSLALAGGEIKGETWDASCDPRILAAYDQLRPNDPAAFAQKWNIGQMHNPPFIEALRSMPPVAAPTPITTLPNGMVVTPYSILMDPNARTPSYMNGGVGSAPRLRVANALPTSIAPPSNGGRVISPVRRQVTAASGSGVQMGSASVQAVRSAAYRVRSNREPLVNANALKGGSTQVRTVSVRALSSVSVQNTNQARETSLRVMAARASRSTSDGILRQVNQTRSNLSNRSLNPNPNSNQQQDEIRRQLEEKLLGFKRNIDIAARMANETRTKIVNLIAERDALIDQVTREAFTKPDRKVLSMLNSLRSKLLVMDKELGVQKAQYDAYQGAIASQQSFMSIVSQFGPDSLNPSGSGGGSGSGSASGSGGRGVRGAWLIKLWSLPTAFASDAWTDEVKLSGTLLGKYKNSAEWLKGWNEFLVSYENRVNLERSADKKEREELAKLYMDNIANADQGTLFKMNTEAQVAADIFTDALLVEGDDLRTYLASPDGTGIRGRSQALTSLEDMRKEASKARDALDELTWNYRKEIPSSYENNPEVWWGMVSEIIVY